MKKIAFGLAGVFVVAIAAAVAKQLSSEAMAVIVGIVCGIGASIPTSLVMLYLLSRQEQAEEREEQQRQTAAPPSAPTVMIVNPAGGMMGQPFFPQQGMGQYYPPMSIPMNANGRQYYLLGSDEADER